MAKIFDLDNPVWRFMGKVFDMMVLTVLWVVTSLPVVTIGASTTALYYVGMKLARDEEGYIIKDFFRSFKENFRQATAAWAILLALGIFFAVDLTWYYQFKSGVGVMIFFMFVILTALYIIGKADISDGICDVSQKFRLDAADGDDNGVRTGDRAVRLRAGADLIRRAVCLYSWKDSLYCI